MAKKAESTLKNMLLSLTIIALIAAAVLAALNSVTEEPIRRVQEEKVKKSIEAVMPHFENLVDTIVAVDGNDLVCHLGYDANQTLVGVAIEGGDNNGFGGALRLMVGYAVDGTISGYSILETHETPGLGAKADTWFNTIIDKKGNANVGKGNVIGKSPATSNLTVKKDGGEVDAISGSTITSRAFLRVIDLTFKAYNQIVNDQQ